MPKILVTGGAGFIGSHLADRLVDLGHEVVCIDNLMTGRVDNVNPKAKLLINDIRDEAISRIFEIEKPEYVFHLAAQMSVPHSVDDPKFDLDVNGMGLINLLENSVKHGVKKFIFSSSGGAIYGDADEFPTTENFNPVPMSPYAITKLVSEKYLHFYKEHYGLNFTVLRYANVYGPRQANAHESGVVTIFVSRILKEQDCKIYTYPETDQGMLRDYVYVGDVVNANIKAIESGDNDIFNIGTGTPTSTLDLFNAVSEKSGINVNYELGPPRKGDIRRSCLKIDKAKTYLGWEPEFDLNNGLTDTLEYFRRIL
jgi:UDP-glucose 4-epimerase